MAQAFVQHGCFPSLGQPCGMNPRCSFLTVRKSPVGSQEHKYSWKPPPMAGPSRRCLASVDTHGGVTRTHLVHPLDTLAPQNIPFPCLTPTLDACAPLKQSCSPPLPSLHQSFPVSTPFPHPQQAPRTCSCDAEISLGLRSVTGNGFTFG